MIRKIIMLAITSTAIDYNNNDYSYKIIKMIKYDTNILIIMI